MGDAGGGETMKTPMYGEMPMAECMPSATIVVPFMPVSLKVDSRAGPQMAIDLRDRLPLIRALLKDEERGMLLRTVSRMGDYAARLERESGVRAGRVWSDAAVLRNLLGDE